MRLSRWVGWRNVLEGYGESVPGARVSPLRFVHHRWIFDVVELTTGHQLTEEKDA
jgi:hypothetical protein